MTEIEHATVLADKVLDRPHGDPDDDLAVLARQFSRARERESKSASALVAVREAVKDHPDFQNREKFLSLGMQVNDALKSVAHLP